MANHVHEILVTVRKLERAHAAQEAVPIASIRVLIAEIEQMVRDSATELSVMGDRVSLDDRNEHGFPTRLGMRY